MSLELVSSNKGPLAYQTLYTDNLIECIFQYITKYLGDPQIERGDLYATSINLLEKVTKQGLPASTLIYDTQRDIWERRSQQFSESFPITLVPCPVLNGAKSLFDPLRLNYQDLSSIDPDIPALRDQDILHYSSYLFAEDFLRHLEGEETMVNFPPVLKVLQRDNLDDIIRNSLEQQSEFIFLPAPENQGIALGFSRKN